MYIFSFNFNRLRFYVHLFTSRSVLNILLIVILAETAAGRGIVLIT